MKRVADTNNSLVIDVIHWAVAINSKVVAYTNNAFDMIETHKVAVVTNNADQVDSNNVDLVDLEIVQDHNKNNYLSVVNN